MRVSAILVAAGSSRRMGFDKLAADLLGQSVLMRSFLALEACPEISEILVVTSPDRIEEIRQEAERGGLKKLREVIPGGAERYQSVHVGLSRLGDETDLVAVHDAARPLVTSTAITRCITAAADTGAAALAHRIVDTLKRADSSGIVSQAVNRENLWAMETPQVFSLTLLKEAYVTLITRGRAATDEVSVVAELGHPVQLVENQAPNPKITLPGDLELARVLLQARMEETA